MKMTLSRALRYKKRVVEKVRKLEGDIQAFNSRISGAVEPVNVVDCLLSRKKSIEHLLELKVALQKATAPIMPKILELGELKSEIRFLSGLNVTEGKQPQRYMEAEPTFYVVTINKKERDKLITELEGRIDELQSEIDLHNAKTEIELSQEL